MQERSFFDPQLGVIVASLRDSPPGTREIDLLFFRTIRLKQCADPLLRKGTDTHHFISLSTEKTCDAPADGTAVISRSLLWWPSARIHPVAISDHPIRQNGLLPQQFLNGEVHDWYRIVHGFSDHLVARLLKEFQLLDGQRVLDPFCGAGTTLVECCKLKIDSVGIDANPASCFAASVKTDWGVRPSRLLALIPQVAIHYKNLLKNPLRLKKDPTYGYLFSSGMIKRGWINDRRLVKAIAIKSAINKLNAPRSYKQALHLALVTEVVNTASNVRFGPELYCGESRKGVNLLDSFQERAREMSRDLGIMRDMGGANAKVFRGDSRSCAELLSRNGYRRFHAVICSPPYPAEHDYTRNSRLELAFLEAVDDRRSLQKIKKKMIRSHTKNIYEGDIDSDQVSDSLVIDRIADKITQRTKGKTHGFARLYAKVLKEYFGGMKRHFKEVMKVLSPGARCAYVVGDQSSYLQVHIPTAKILSELAKDVGFHDIKIAHWRSRWSSTTAKRINENILLMSKPKIARKESVGRKRG